MGLDLYTALANDTDPNQTAVFARNVGVSLITLGCAGIILNVLCLLYFVKLKTETANSAFTRIAFINLAVVDLLLSLSSCLLKGPGYVWPEKIWGEHVVKNEGYSTWCEAGTLLIWYVSDLNLLGVIPLSLLFVLLYVPFLSLTLVNLIICIVICWCIPAVEILFIVVASSTGKLTVTYKDIYRRCSLGGDYEHVLNRENSTVFFALPTFVHVMSWSLIIFHVCRQGNSFQDKQWWKFLKTGVIVVITFTLTWLPYFIVVPWHDLEPTGWFAFVFCFLYASTVLNPLIYGIRSMQFNGKSISDIFVDAFCILRARALSRPVVPRNLNPCMAAPAPSSYVDLEEEEEELK